MKRLTAFLAALLLVFSAVVFAAAEDDEDSLPIFPLPVDFSPGNPLDPSCFHTDPDCYDDPSIHVDVTSGEYNGVRYWIADITITEPSQLRTAAAESFSDKRARELGSVIARRMNAVLAVDGDYYNYTSNNDVHVTIRQGYTFQNSLLPRACQDVLLIDEDGDFHGIEDPMAGDIGTEINGKKIINAFYFGPLLVNNGEKRGIRAVPSRIMDGRMRLPLRRGRPAQVQAPPGAQALRRLRRVLQGSGRNDIRTGEVLAQPKPPLFQFLSLFPFTPR